MKGMEGDDGHKYRNEVIEMKMRTYKGMEDSSDKVVYKEMESA